jgi:hypothetical protein
MIRIYQRFIIDYGGRGYGDCMAACIESILEKPVNLLNFYTKKHFGWEMVLFNLNIDLKEIGYRAFQVPGHLVLKNQYSIDTYIFGKSHSHAVVGYNNKLIHDPSDKPSVVLGCVVEPGKYNTGVNIKYEYMRRTRLPNFKYYLEKL